MCSADVWVGVVCRKVKDYNESPLVEDWEEFRGKLENLSMSSEQRIVEGCRLGDNAARKELYLRYGGFMLGLIMRYVADREEAKDLLHDGFIMAYDKFGQFQWRGEGSLRAWLSRLFVNVTLNWLRQTKVMQNCVSIEETPDLEDEPMVEEVNNLPQDVLLHFIAELPAGYRTVFNLFAIEGHSHKEIARMLHIKERTSSSQFFKAKRILAQKIHSYLSN